MFQTAYVSRAAEAMTQESLLSLLQQCLTNNEASGVTGMLLYGNGTFLQVLEGEEAVLEAVIEKIEKDPRHSKIHFLYRKPVEHRQYADWSSRRNFDGALPRTALGSSDTRTRCQG